ncbi:MAG: biotin--[acetyl-CoA-carboxylase] ligase [Bacteroidetes bacterium]|nr:biotin--[acetyl-CoA-carboxylase] ligase [Bacteroidota bacterium]
MRLVKLDAIDSTNNYLKELIRRDEIENFTIISAQEQTNGRGQMGSVWNSEKGKNIIMSVLVKDFLSDASEVFNLNMAFSLAVLSVLKKHQIPDLSVKWPNDIMSGNKKVGGILIENTFKSEREIQSVIGLGLNVNQSDFDHLPQASSLYLVSGRIFDKDILILEIANQLKVNLEHWSVKHEQFRAHYVASLFKRNKIMKFKRADDSVFEGYVVGIDDTGKLLINSSQGISAYDIKEVQMIY